MTDLQLMQRLGRDRHDHQLRRLREQDLESLTPAGRRLVAGVMPTLESAVRDWLDDSGPGRSRQHTAVVRAIGPARAAHIALVLCLNDCFKRPTASAEAAKIGRAYDMERRLDGLCALYQRRAARRGAVSAKELARIRSRIPGLPAVERMGAGLAVLSMVLDSGIILARREVRRGKWTKVLAPSPAAVEWLETAHEAARESALWRLPQPEAWPWSAFEDGPYADFESSVNRGVAEQHDGVEDVLNRLGSVPLLVDRGLEEVLRSLWGRGVDAPGAPRRFTPNVRGGEWNLEGRRAWAAWYQEAGRRHNVQSVLLSAKHAPDRGFFPHRADSRGRVYAMPEGLSPQGSDVARSLLRFEPRPLADPYWLDAHLGRCWGLDKMAFDDRASWTREHLPLVEAVAEDPEGTLPEWRHAGDPWRFVAACRARVEWQVTGLCGLPCEHDLTSSVYQILALLTADSELAARVNLTPSRRPRDLYGELVDEWLRDPPPDWAIWLLARRKRLRDVVKHWAVAGGYGAHFSELWRWTRHWVDAQEGDPPSGGRTEDLARSLAALIPGSAVLEWVQECGRVLSRSGVKDIRWRTKSGFLARSHYPRRYNRRVTTRVGKTTRYATLSFHGDRPDARKGPTALSPNFVHSLDAAVVHAVARRFRGPLITIHDCFATTPDLVPDLRDSVRDALSAVGPRDLQSFRDDVQSLTTEELPEPPEPGSFDSSLVRRSTYCLH